MRFFGFILLIFLFIIPISFAVPGPISVLDLSYEEGEIVLHERVEGFGYYPDRKAESGDATVEVMADGVVLYSTSFVPPFVEFLDGTSGDVSLGGVLVVDSFALVVPSFAGEDAIIIAGKGYTRSYDVGEKGSILLPLLLILAIVTILIILMIRISRR